MARLDAVRPERALEARSLFQSKGSLLNGVLPHTIEASWTRCSARGLHMEDPQYFDPLRRDDLYEILQKNQTLVSHALPVMETLYQQIANTQSMVLLTDAHGLVLHSLGDADFLERAQRVALTPGVEWSEQSKGTNAIGTAIMERGPVLVHGPEHFLTANNFLTCSAAPVVDPHGKTVGVLDISGDYRGHNQHTMALVKMSAQMIENQLFTHAFPDSVSLHFHARPEFIGTLCEGIISFTAEGDFISANRSGCFQLGFDLDQLGGRSFGTLFDLPFRAVLDHAMLQPHSLLTLCLRSGVRVYARVRFGEKTRRPGPAVFTYERSSANAAPAVHTRQNAPRFGGSLSSLLTGDPQMESVINKVRKVLGRGITILIQGDTGTGKELLARAIHNDGPRHGGPFVAVNCASIPDGLIESELFGYEEGAFTGARRKGAVGKILQADGGTLFLDEIGDMPLNLQARLLRVLQERTVTPLGSVKSCPVDVAIVCATNRKLRDMVGRGEFREDLYYRLNGLTVNLPPLRNRADVREVIMRILRTETADGIEPVVAPDVMDMFLRHPWPGNLRQLSNLLQTALVMCDDDRVIRCDHLPDDFLADLEHIEPVIEQPLPSAVTFATGAPATVAANMSSSSSGSLEKLELNAIREALQRNVGNISAASRQLGISRNTLYRKLKSL